MKAVKGKTLKTSQKNIGSGDARLRLSVFRSNRYFYAQIIDDGVGETIVSASEKDLKDRRGKKIDQAAKVGDLLAQKSQKLKVKVVRFDRNGYKYHGRVKAFADAVRKGGLVF